MKLSIFLLLQILHFYLDTNPLIYRLFDFCILEIQLQNVYQEISPYLKYFDGFTLYTIDGEEIGKYIDGTIVVTYIYEPTDDEPGIGFTPGPSEELEITPPSTGVETESQNIYLVILLMLSSTCLYRYASGKE